MRIGQLSAALGISKDAVNSWLKRAELAKFFSESAMGQGGKAQREFTDADISVLNTIRHLRFDEKQSDWQAIVAYLESGERVQQFPSAAAGASERTIPLQQAEASVKAAATLAERDSALAKAAYLESELAASREKNESLLREIGELRYQIGRLEAELEALKGDK